MALRTRRRFLRDRWSASRRGERVLQFLRSARLQGLENRHATADQGGLSLPDRDYYFKIDQKSVELRDQFEKHVAKTFELYGESPEKAAADAKTVMKVETDLVKVSLDSTDQRDPNKNYHKMNVSELQKLTPAFAWNQYFTTIQSPSFDSLNVAVPDFVKGMNQVVTSNDLDTVKTYLRWQTVPPPPRFCPGIRRGRLQFLRQDPEGSQGTSSALEALCAVRPIAISARHWARLTWPRRSLPKPRRAPESHGV